MHKGRDAAADCAGIWKKEETGMKCERGCMRRRSGWGKRLCAAAAALMCLFLGFSLTEAVAEGASDMQHPELTVSILKVGKADAIVVHEENHAMIIDAGEDEDGVEVVAYLHNHGLESVDVMIITHFDKDHVGGADTVLRGVKVNRVLLPHYTGEGPEYDEFMEALNACGVKPEYLDAPEAFAFGSASVKVEPPLDYEVKGKGEVDNNFSLITTVVHGNCRLLFTGDIEKKRIRAWLEGGTAEPCDFLKIPHHGSYNSALEQLLDTVRPSIAAICCSAKNPADQELLDLLADRGIQTAETTYGDITVISDGNKVSMYQ